MRNAYKEKEIVNLALMRGYTRQDASKLDNSKNFKQSYSIIHIKPPITSNRTNRSGIQPDQSQINFSYPNNHNNNNNHIINGNQNNNSFVNQNGWNIQNISNHNNNNSFNSERAQGLSTIDDHSNPSSKIPTESSFTMNNQSQQHQQLQQIVTSQALQGQQGQQGGCSQINLPSYQSSNTNGTDYYSQVQLNQQTSPNNQQLPTIYPMNIQDINIKENNQPDDQSSRIITSQTDHFQPEIFNTQEVKNDERVPLLFVDVNLGMGKIERIVVYECDRSEDLAKNFAQIHNLDQVTRQKFKEMLDSQIAGLLSRIDEEEMLSCESDSQAHQSLFMNNHNLQYQPHQYPSQNVSNRNQVSSSTSSARLIERSILQPSHLINK